MHKTLASALTVALTLAGGTAFAQQFSDQGTLAFSADRLFGFYLTERNVELDDVPARQDNDAFEVGLLWQGPGLTPFTIPRLGVDYFVINHLSIGGTVGFTSADDDDNGIDYQAFLFAPRVGGAWMFNDWAGIWPRGGFSYYSFDVGNTDASQFSLTAECQFVLSPAEGFAFVVGPAFDIGLTGGWDPPGPGSGDVNMYSIGLLTAGVMGYINL